MRIIFIETQLEDGSTVWLHPAEYRSYRLTGKQQMLLCETRDPVGRIESVRKKFEKIWARSEELSMVQARIAAAAIAAAVAAPAPAVLTPSWASTPSSAVFPRRDDGVPPPGININFSIKISVGVSLRVGAITKTPRIIRIKFESRNTLDPPGSTPRPGSTA